MSPDPFPIFEVGDRQRQTRPHPQKPGRVRTQGTSASNTEISKLRDNCITVVGGIIIHMCSNGYILSLCCALAVAT